MDRGQVAFLLVLLVVAALALSVTASAATLPLEDGFEAVATGAYPVEGGWLTLSSGKSAWVSDEVSYSGSKSFRLDCWPWSASTEYLHLEEVPDRFSYQASIYVDARHGLVGLVGFMDGSPDQSVMWNYFRVDGGARFIAFYGATTVDLGPYIPGTWCAVRADLDYQALTADLWVDGELAALGVPITPKEFHDAALGEVALDKWGLNSTNRYEYRSFVFSNVVYYDDVRLEAVESALTVDIDIKPGSYPNSVNPRSRGLVPVAVLSSDSFDAAEVDIGTVSLLGAGVAVRSRHGRVMAHEEDVDGDGWLDLVLHFETRELDFGQLEDGWAALTGATYDGVQFEGWDEVRLRPRR